MDWFYLNAQSKFGKKRVDTYLQNKAVKSDYIAAFLNSISRTEIQDNKAFDSPILPTLDDLINASRTNRRRAVALRFAKIATEDELIKLAKYAMEETNLEIKLELLWAFRKVRFPLEAQFIFELAENDNESIRNVAFEILQHFSPDMIHDYALNLINQEQKLANALSLLCSCFRTDDEAVLLNNIHKLSVSYEEGDWHSVFIDVEDLLNNRSVTINSSVFIYMYRQTLCAYCRHCLILKMAKRKILPKEILEECLYDSYEDTRKFAARKLKR